jgi:hypothetical protein
MYEIYTIRNHRAFVEFTTLFKNRKQFIADFRKGNDDKKLEHRLKDIDECLDALGTLAFGQKEYQELMVAEKEYEELMEAEANGEDVF